MRRQFALLFVLCAAICFLASASYAEHSGLTTLYNGVEVSADSLLVVPEEGADFSVLSEITAVSEVKGTRLSYIDGVRVDLSKVKGLDASKYVSHMAVEFAPGMGLEEMIEAMESLPGVEAAYPNHIYYPSFTPNDPAFGLQQNFRQIYVNDAWELSRGEGVKVGIIDTGYLAAGLSDQAVFIDRGYDFWGSDTDTNDYIGHGTHIANTVAQATDNGIGQAGIAHAAEILVLKVFPDSDGGAYEGDILDAINYAVDNGAQVINLSLGGGGSSSLSRQTFAQAKAAGVVAVCASGNSGVTPVEYPAAYEGCIAVGSGGQHATGSTASRSGFSNYGSALDLLAPGEGIIQETYTPGWGVGAMPFWGTSSASPHVAGVVALMISYGGRTDPELIVESLHSSAQDIPPTGFDNQTGYGEVHAFDAMVYYADHLNIAPVAAFDGELVEPLTVYLNAQESSDEDGTIIAYAWDLGDGQTAEGVEVTHVFPEAGQYTVVLTVTDDKGVTDTADRTLTLTASDDDDEGDDDDDDDDDDGCGC